MSGMRSPRARAGRLLAWPTGGAWGGERSTRSAAARAVFAGAHDEDNGEICEAARCGARGSTFTLASEVVALDGAQILSAWQSGGLIFVGSLSSAGPAWIRVFSGSAILSAITADGAHGAVFAGEQLSPIDFGGGTLPKPPTGENGPANAFIVKLAGSDGAHVFSRRTGVTLIGGLAANATRIARSTTWRTQFRYHELQVFDLAGNPVGGTPPEQALGLGEHGVAHAVALSSTGRAWWNIDSLWPYLPAWPYLLALNAP